MDCGAARRRSVHERKRRQVELICHTSNVFQVGLCFSGFFNLHIAELVGVKDVATIQAFNKLAVFMPGDDAYFRVLADGCHRSQVGV